MQPFTLLIKPSGSDCNIDCKYCFYKERAPEVGRGRQRMSDEVLEKLVKDYMNLRFQMSGFAWQGGEPTLMGLDFYKKAVELQKRYGASGQEVGNSLQTNAILINNADWGRFLHEAKFLVGVSIDGPKDLHDFYRLDLGGHGTWDRVMAAIACCKEHQVEFNTLSLVNNLTGDRPDEVCHGRDREFLRLSRAVRRFPLSHLRPLAGIRPAEAQYPRLRFDPELLRRRTPHDLHLRPAMQPVHRHRAYRRGLSVRLLRRPEVAARQHLRDAHREDRAKKRAFARKKQNLCNKCLICRHLAICRGGCMKDRAPFDKHNYGRESYFCESYRKFFDYALPRFMQLAAQIRAGSLVRPPELT